METRKGLSGTKGNLEGSCEEFDDHHLQRAPARLPSASSLARRLLLLPAIEFFWSTSAREEKFRLAKA
jgi:hypothetical protein